MLTYEQLPDNLKSLLTDLNKFLPRVEHAILTDDSFGPGDVWTYVLLFDNGEGEIMWWGSEWPVFSPTGDSMDEHIAKLAKDGYSVVYRNTFKD